jgi:hypothetical protein
MDNAGYNQKKKDIIMGMVVLVFVYMKNMETTELIRFILGS